MNRVTSAFKYSAFKHHCALCAAACGFAYASIANANDCSPWDATIGQPGMNGAVWSLAALPNGDLIAGGNFTTAGGVEASRIARWDGSNWHNLGDGVNGGVLALVVLPDGDVIAAGLFTMAGDTPVSNIARWDGTNWHALGSGVDGAVRALAVMASGDVIAGGHFTTAGGIPVNHIASWDGSLWHDLSGGTDAPVFAITVFDDGDGDGAALHVGGEFTIAGGVQVNRIARLDGDTWSPLDTGIDAPVQVLQAYHGKNSRTLYAAGPAMTAAGYVPLFMGMARWDGDAREWSPDGDGMRGEVRAMTVSNDGDGPALFAAISGPEPGQSYLARWDGWWWMPVSSPVQGTVYALSNADHGEGIALYAAGTLTLAGDEQAAGIARWQHCPATPPVIRQVPGEYATIQAGIDAAEDGDIVRVAPGTYHEAIDFLGKTIVVESEAGAEKTIIDATRLDTSVVTVDNGEGLGTTLRGFTVTGGVGMIPGSSRLGGGIFVRESTLAIENCTVEGNEALEGALGAGGGIAAVVGSEVLVVNTGFVGNTANIGGGAIVNHNRQARFVDCDFLHNSCESSGAGIEVNVGGIAVIRGCHFEEHSAHGAGAVLLWGRGGVVEHCTFQSNHAEMGYGGAIFSSAINTIRHSSFVSNSAAIDGGAIAANAAGEVTKISNSYFEGNSASHGGALLANGAAVEDSTFCNNSPQHISSSYNDLGGNTFADSCEPLLGDLNGDGVVDVSDLLILLGAWGACPTGGTPVPLDAPPCPADFNGDGAVDVSDLLILLSNWG